MRDRSVRLLVALALAGVPSAFGSAQGRLRPPEFVTCDRNRLTSYTGRVVSLSQAGHTTTLRMETDESTKERFVLRHPGSDATAWFTLGGRPFTAADWTALLPAGRLRAGARATVWVCVDEPNPRVDWEASAAAADPAIRLVVRGDDMGSSQAANEASIRCFRDGVLRDVELMAVGPWFPEAARLLRENPGLDVGLHLALTSEWDNVKWRPLTTAPSLVGPDGYFHPMIWPHPHYGRAGALKEQPWRLDEIERELRAQIEITRREVPHLSHLSDHMGFQALGPEVAALVKRLAGEYGLGVDPEALGARWVGWDGKPLTPEEKVSSFLRVLEKLEPGTWIFVDHPALDTPEMRAIGHVGYENVAVDRQGVTDAWTSPAAKAVVERRGIELVGYRDLAPEASSRVPTRAERGSTWANDLPFASGRVGCAVRESPGKGRSTAGTPADGSRGIRGTADPSTPVGAEASRDDGGESAASAIDRRGNR